jgi:hypothetical protein
MTGATLLYNIQFPTFLFYPLDPMGCVASGTYWCQGIAINYCSTMDTILKDTDYTGMALPTGLWYINPGNGGRRDVMGLYIVCAMTVATIGCYQEATFTNSPAMDAIHICLIGITRWDIIFFY